MAAALFQRDRHRRAPRMPTSRRSSIASPTRSTMRWRKLHYAAPRLVDRGDDRAAPVRRARDSTFSTPAAAPGCAVRCCARSARRLVGVDLSRGHAGQSARAPGLRRAARIRASSRSCARIRASYDVVISADTLVYFGALEEAIRSPRQRAQARWGAGVYRRSRARRCRPRNSGCTRVAVTRIHRTTCANVSKPLASLCCLIEGAVLRKEGGRRHARAVVLDHRPS